MTILQLDSSPRGDRSHSRALTHAFVEELKQQHPGAHVVKRDLGHNPVPHVTEPWIAAAYSSPENHSPQAKEAIAVSDKLVDELLAADILVIGAPMYNFSIPSTLKAWVDQVVRVGRTVVYHPEPQGLVEGKKAFLLVARGAGGYSEGKPMAGINYQDTYLKFVLGFIGITDVTVVADEKTLSNESDLPGSIERVKQAARDLAVAA